MTSLSVTFCPDKNWWQPYTLTPYPPPSSSSCPTTLCLLFNHRPVTMWIEVTEVTKSGTTTANMWNSQPIQVTVESQVLYCEINVLHMTHTKPNHKGVHCTRLSVLSMASMDLITIHKLNLFLLLLLSFSQLNDFGKTKNHQHLHCNTILLF